MKCTQGNEIQVFKSAAGWYIGCYDNEGPRCRISGYYKKKESAEKALEHKTFFPDEECVLCPGVWSCLPEEDEGDTDGDEDWLQYANNIMPSDCPFNGSAVCLNGCKKCLPF